MKELEPQNRLLGSWIDAFLELSESHPTTLRYRKWVAISAIASALSRKCWVISARRRLYANLYIMLVGEPGMGKDVAIEIAEAIIRQAEIIFLSPSSMSNKGLVDTFAEEGAKTFYITVDKKTKLPQQIPFHQMLACIPELGTTLAEYSSSFLSIANELYGCKNEFVDRIRGKSEPVTITKPCLNLLLGTQPDYLGTTFKDEAFGMGFFSRMIMVFDNNLPVVNLWDDEDEEDEREETEEEKRLRAFLVSDLRRISKLTGRFTVVKKAKEALDEWHKTTSYTEVQRHTKLKHYNTRRILHLLKLCMVLSASRSDSLEITIEDFTKAHEILLDAEKEMPTIFSVMTNSRSDRAALEEAKHFIKSKCNGSKKPIPEHKLVKFLSGKVPLHFINNMIEQLIAVRYIKEVGTIANGERLLRPYN